LTRQEKSQALEQLRSLSWLLDDSIQIPGTNYRIGIDPLLGLIPGIGDFVGSALSGYIIISAAAMGASSATLARMLVNVLIEGVVGCIPLLGDIFDAGWKANLRNIDLLDREIATGKPLKSSKLVVAGVAILAICLVAFVVALAILVIHGAYEVIANTFDLGSSARRN
jgi:hypothetical protein